MNARFRLGIGELTGLDPIAIIVLAGFDGGVVTVVTLIIPLTYLFTEVMIIRTPQE